MDSYRLPKIMLHSQLLGDLSYKSALLEDMRTFGIMDRKSKDNCCINTLKWEMLLEMMYIAENTKSNKRHVSLME